MTQKPVPRRLLLRAAGAGGALALAPAASRAQSYPSRPIRLVVGFPPGGSNDAVARILAPKLGEILRTTVVVENKPGANATIGTQHVARSEPDGYTFLLGGASPLAISPHTFPNIPYDPLKDFEGVTTVAMTPEVVAVNPSVPARTLRELVALGKTRDLTIASSGNGGLPHLAIELFRKAAGAKVTHVPYKGGGPAAVDTVSGQVNAIIMDMPALYQLIKEGKLRALAVTNERRASLLPDVPTSGEEGLPDLQAVNWFAVMAPVGTSKEIVGKVHAAALEASNSADVRQQFASLGIEAMTQPSPAAFAQFLRSEIDRWGVIARESGARVE